MFTEASSSATGTSHAGAMAGRTIVVVGASGGVGEGVTRALLHQGANVVAVGRSPERLAQLRGLLAQEGAGDLKIYRADVTTEDPVVIGRGLVERFGLAHAAIVSIGNAGPMRRNPSVLEMGDADVLAMVKANELLGLRGLQAAVAAVRPDGVVIQLLGFSSEIPFPHNPLVGSTNAALRSLVGSLAVQLGTSGPRVHGLIIGVVRTRARKMVGIDNPSWLTGEAVGDGVAALIADGGGDIFHHLLDPSTRVAAGVRP